MAPKLVVETAIGGPTQIVLYADSNACDPSPCNCPAVSPLLRTVQPHTAVTCRLLLGDANHTVWSAAIRSAGVSHLVTISATLNIQSMPLQTSPQRHRDEETRFTTKRRFIAPMRSPICNVNVIWCPCTAHRLPIRCHITTLGHCSCQRLRDFSLALLRSDPYN